MCAVFECIIVCICKVVLPEHSTPLIFRYWKIVMPVLFLLVVPVNRVIKNGNV